MGQDLDIVAIGDIVIDAFIRLKDKEAEVHCDENDEHCRLSMVFGDKIPYESVTICPAVGNSPNAAVAATRLGLKVALVTNIGDDLNGKDCLASLKKDGVATNFIKVNDGQKTNYHYVLWYKDDRTILIKHEEYKYNLSDIGNPKWLYLSSLGEHSLDFHHEIGRYLESHREIKLAFQPGTYQIRFGADKLTDIYAKTEISFCNREEAQHITKTEEEDILKLAEAMHRLGPKMVVITDGYNGAYAYANGELWQMPIYPDPAPPVDRTGAGDAFASTVVAALALGKTLPEALTWGPVNSMSVVQAVGAQAGLLNKEKINEYLAKAPENYKAQKIN
ncbi:MAG: carbohydrate kinase family protein [Patescibacteria group bacterium]